MSVGYDTWSTRKNNTIFKIKNVSNKDIRIFNVKIYPGHVYDLMTLHWVSEVDIRQSLLKGILYKKIIQNAIEVIESTVDLTQYDDAQKEFLNNAGIELGTQGYTDVLFDGEEIAKSTALNFTGEGVTVYDNDGITEINISGGSGSGTYYQEIIYQGSTLPQREALLFTGNAVENVFDDMGGTTVEVNAYTTVAYNFEDVIKRERINFTGEGVNVFDNEGTTEVQISGGGGTLIIPIDGEFPEIYIGNVVCAGDAFITTNTNIIGSVTSPGRIKNLSGYYVQISGDLTADNLDWEPNEGFSSSQNNLNVNGSVQASQINFPIVTRDTEGPVTLNVGGDLHVTGYLNGEGYPACNGLRLQVYGNVVSRGNVSISGGDSTVEYDAGNGGEIYVGGSFIQQSDEGGGSIAGYGGDSYYNDRVAGNGGNVHIVGNFTGNISIYGGESNTSDGNNSPSSAGQGGNIFINGSAVAGWLETNGGFCYSDNNNAHSGSGGNVRIVGNCKAYYIETGSGGRAGNTTAPAENASYVESGTIYVNGDLICQELYGDGGNNSTNYFCQFGSPGADVYVEGSLISNDGIYINGGSVNITYNDAYAGSGGDVEAVFIMADTIRAEGGSGYRGGNGGSIDAYKLSGSTYVDLDGGSTEGDADGGRGGDIYLAAGGEFDSIRSRGGSCLSTDNFWGFGGGNGGNINVYSGNLICDDIDISGGNRTGATTTVNDTYSGCDAGSIFIDNGDLICNDISMNGGSRTTTYRSGPGGNSGAFNVDGNVTVVNYIESIGGNSFGGDGGMTNQFVIRGSLYSNSVSIITGASYADAGSNSGNMGDASDIQIQGSTNVNEFYFMDGASGDSPPVSPPVMLLEGNHHFKLLNVSENRIIKAFNADSNVIFTAQAMQEKDTLNNDSDDTPTAPIGSDLQSSIFKHGVGGWYKISGTSI